MKICASDNLWYWIFAAVLVSGPHLPATAESDPLKRDDPSRWGFGEGLSTGDSFQYRICDAPLRIAESPDPCYVVTLRFLDLLPSPSGMVWVVAANVEHGTRHVDMILHISESFEIETDQTTMAYANSLERTLGWANNYAPKLKPEILAVGTSWGTVASGTEWADLMVNRVDYLEFDGQLRPIHVVGYHLVKESFLHIRDGFPFPIKATIYKPISSHQNIPAVFTIDLLSYHNAKPICGVHADQSLTDVPGLEFGANVTGFPANFTKAQVTEFEELLDDDSDDEFDIISSESEISEIEANSTVETNSTPDQSVPLDLNDIFGNFTKFIQNFANLTNKIINQTEN